MGLANEETDMLATGTPPKREEVVRLWDVVYTWNGIVNVLSVDLIEVLR